MMVRGRCRFGRSWRWQNGHRGSHAAVARATARRAVMNESAKWRSGRASVRTSVTSPSGREGKNAVAFSHHEREAAQGD